MTLIPLNDAMAGHLQVRIAALANLHRDLAMLTESTDLPTLLRTGERIAERLRELPPRFINEHEMLEFRSQARKISNDCRRLLERAQ
ncbi:hypothetical protein [Pseudomonas aeruginosa]|uniref:hypothetical protein n=1 Tax=Pseudomonas aeruginosa TaxID=287 RepID=UPI0034582D9C